MTAGREVPADVELLVDASARNQRARNGVPDEQTAAGRVRCQELVLDLLGSSIEPGSLTCSPLGPEWTDVFEVTLTTPVVPAAPAAAGWLPLDRLLPGEAPGSPVLGTWGVVEDGRVLAGVRLLSSARSRSPVDQLLSRCAARREVRLCDVLELRELRRAGCEMPPSSVVLAAAADVESGLGGRLLAPWATGRSACAPVPLRQLRRPGRSRLVVAVSGVDGSGKTTLRTAVESDLRRAGVQVSTVWVRPGMGLGPLVQVAAWAKRLLRQPQTPGVRAMGEPGGAATGLRSRRGLVGWAWATLVCSSFLAGVWRQHARADGVVLYDRHLVDALATLDFAYEGVDLRLQRAMVRALLPRADVSLYLDVPLEVSVTRKPDEVFGAAAVDRQLTAYAHWLGRLPGAHRLDATRPAPDLVQEALRLLTTSPR